MPGSPNRTEIQTQVNDGLDAIDSIRQGGTNFLADAAVAEASVEGDHLPVALVGLMQSLRSQLASIMNPATASRVWVPALREFGKLIDSPGVNTGSLLQLRNDLYEDMIANAQYVNSRNITRGTPAAGGSNVGDGLLVRLTQDWNQMPLEASWSPDTMTARCDIDGGSQGGRYGAEIFFVYSGTPALDSLEQLGSGINGEQLPVMHAGTSGPGRSLLRNPSFDVAHAADDASTSKVSSWTATTPENLEESSTVPMAAPGVSLANSQSLEFEGNAKVSQAFEDFLPGGLPNLLANPRPMFGAVLLNRQSSADGNFSFTVGSQTVTVDLTTLTNGTWTWLIWKTDHNCWPQNFNQDALSVDLERTGATTGSVLVDHAHLNYWTEINGAFMALRGGPTHFLFGDEFTITDTGGAIEDAEVQWFFAHALRRALGWRAYLPSNNAGGETWSDF